MSLTWRGLSRHPRRSRPCCLGSLGSLAGLLARRRLGRVGLRIGRRRHVCRIGHRGQQHRRQIQTRSHSISSVQTGGNKPTTARGNPGKMARICGATMRCPKIKSKTPQRRLSCVNHPERWRIAENTLPRAQHKLVRYCAERSARANTTKTATSSLRRSEDPSGHLNWSNRHFRAIAASKLPYCDALSLRESTQSSFV